MAMRMTLEELAALIATLASAAPLTMVALDGPSGAGKTAAADRLQSMLPGSRTVHVDDFYSRLGVAPPAGLTPEEGYEGHVNWRLMAAQTLSPLRCGLAGRYQPYDWVADRREPWVTVPPVGVVLVEGVYAMRPELMGYYDLTVFVETPPQVRAARIAARPDDPALVERWSGADDWYHRRHRTLERADVALTGR